ncbi:MAG: hypothetical protein A2Y38_26705 [Spirochaetes bacterium GWB1_59_5]|nr:MAG: hypothetical protein A2Y38_26705 [Spirochaetes bacterium GWB1_59_5]
MPVQKKTILLVEDEAIIATAEKMSLEMYGYSVVLASNGEKAVEVLGTYPEIDLILMDINLGNGIDGTEAAEIILKDYDVPILFLSSHSEREVVERTEKITSYGYVLKNSSITVLDASIKMAFKLFEANYRLETSEEYFRHSFENAALGVCYVGMDGKFQKTNHAFQNMVGYTEEEIINLGFNDITHPEDRSIGLGVLKQLVGGEISKIFFKKRYVRKDKNVFWATVSTSLVKSKGQPNHFIIQIIDITEQKQAEDALRESKETAEMMLNVAAEIIMSEDLEGNITMLNDSGYKILGYESPELIGKNYIETFLPEEIRVDMHAYYSKRKTEDQSKVDTHQYAIVTKPGEKKTIYWRNAIIKDTQGIPMGFLSSGQDITERKLAEIALQGKNEEYAVLNEELNSTTEELQIQNEALNVKEIKLRENERRLTQAEKVAKIGYWILDLDTMTMSASDGANDIYGVNFKKTSLVEVQKIPLLEYRPTLDKALADLVAGQAPYDLEFKIRRPHDGVIVDIHSAATFDKNANTVFGVIQDVTERARTEEALRQSEKRYRGFLANLDDGIIVHAPDTSIIMSNQRASELLGLSEQQLKGMEAIDPAWKFLAEDSSPLPQSEYPVNRILAFKKPIKDCLVGICRPVTCDIVWVMVNGFPVMDDKGQISEILTSFNDITQRKKIEESLRESELKYRSLIESSSDAIFCVDQNGEYKFANYLFASTFGKTADFFIGKTFWDIYPKEHADYRYEATKRVFKTGKSESLEVEVPLPDKTLYFYATANPIIDETGTVILSLTHAVDITERKIAEEKIKSLLAEKELILKEVHHRIKNNMNTMMSLLSLQAGNAKDRFAKEALEDAENRMHSMGILYDKLYQSVGFNLLSVEKYLTTLVDEVVQNFPNSQMVRVEKSFQDFILDANHLQLLGIIINELLTNCMKYAFTGRTSGLITVVTTTIDKHAAITVQDNGNGMPGSVSVDESNGFGLQLVMALTRQLGATIRIERGNGTKVVLEFSIQ